MSELMAAMDADVAKLPQWVQIWINMIGPLLLGSTAILLFNAGTRKIAFLSIAALILGSAVIFALYSKLGMVRLLGVGHVLFWLPLLILVVNRLRQNPPSGIMKIAMLVLAATLAIVLVFDFADVVRWIAGERGSMV